MKTKLATAFAVIALAASTIATSVAVSTSAHAGRALDQLNRANQGENWRNHIYDGRRRPN